MILSQETLKTIRSISLKPSQFNAFAQEAQDLDVASVLGYDLIALIEQNTDEHALLIQGGTYEVDGEKKYFKGLEIALAYFTYARIILESDYFSTNGGLVTKNNDNSQRVALRERQEIARQNQNTAAIYLQQCIDYMATSELYPSITNKPLAARTTFTRIG